MFKRKTLLSSILIALLLFTVACSPASQETGTNTNTDSEKKTEQTETITLKFAGLVPKENIFSSHGIEPFMEQVTKKTNGRVQFEYYPAEQLGKAADLLNLTADGVADMCHCLPNYSASDMPVSSGLWSLPGLINTDTSDAALTFWDITQQSPILEAEYLDHGVRPVVTSIGPLAEILTTNKEIKSPEDLKGLKIFTFGGPVNEVLETFGAIPVHMPVGEAYSALTTGIAEGIAYYPSGAETFGLHEPMKYTTRGLGFGTSGSAFLINEDVFQNLPKDIQDIIIETGKEVTKSFTEFLASENDKLLDEWKSSGKIAVYELTEEDKKAWKPIFDEFTENYLSKQDQQFKDAVEKFKNELDKVNQ